MRFRNRASDHNCRSGIPFSVVSREVQHEKEWLNGCLDRVRLDSWLDSKWGRLVVELLREIVQDLDNSSPSVAHLDILMCIVHNMVAAGSKEGAGVDLALW